jgi:hypothetical protein
MGAVTYPHPDVEHYIERHFVPVQFNVVERPESMDRFNSSWTPSLIVHDAEGREYRRSLGYLDPMRFLGEMALARLLEKVHRRDYAGARDRAAEAIELTKGDRPGNRKPSTSGRWWTTRWRTMRASSSRAGRAC